MPKVLLSAAVALAVLAVNASCAATGLPEVRPDDFTLEVSLSGGMMPLWTRFEVSATHCGIYSQNEGQLTLVACSATPEQLDALYARLRENRFDRIETYEEMTHDRGGVSIAISWADERFAVDDGGMTYIEADWRDEWRNIYEVVQGMMAEMTATAVVRVPVLMDESMVGSSGLTVRLATATASLPTPSPAVQLELAAPAGAHELVVEDQYDAGRSGSATVDFQMGSSVRVSRDPAGGFRIQAH